MDGLIVIGILLLFLAIMWRGETAANKANKAFRDYEEAHRHCVERPYKEPRRNL